MGEVWLDEEGVVFYSELPRPKAKPSGTIPATALARRRHALARRLQRVLRRAPPTTSQTSICGPTTGSTGTARGRSARCPRGEIVTYGELAALAGRPGAARAAGTFCARCDLAPFLPVHRVVAANGLGSWGGLGVGYKRRMLELEDVVL